MAQHHSEGMSRWTSFNECPRYTGKQSTSYAAEFGTRSHAALEALVKGEPVPPCSPEELEAATWAADYIREFVGDSAEVHSETLVTIGEGHGVLSGIFGTCDIWFVLDGQLYVCDFKSIGFTGKDHTPQLMGYAIGIADGIELKTRTVVGMILHGGSRYVSRTEFDLDEAERECAELISRHRTATDLDASPCSCCQYCGHYPCAKVTAELATVEKRWAVKSLAEMMNLAKMAESFAKAVTADVRRVLEAGGTVFDPETGTRYELADRAGAAPLVDVEGLAMLMTGQVGMEREAFLSMISVSKTALVDEILKANAAAVARDPKKFTLLGKRDAAAMIAPFFGEPRKLKVIKRTDIHNKKGK